MDMLFVGLLNPLYHDVDMIELMVGLNLIPIVSFSMLIIMSNFDGF